MAIKRVESIISKKNRKKIFVRLPEEQCLTEETLIKLERRIAQSSRKNDAMLAESMRLANQSPRCMEEHLVEGHVNGNYYISNSDPKIIEAYCETCGDSDTILTSWNPEEKNARLNALLRFFMADILNTKEDIYNSVSQNGFMWQWDGNDIITSLLNDIEYNNEKVFNIVFSLFENKIITEKEFDIIMHISDFEKERQIKMVKYFEKSMFDIDDKTGEKVLKKK